MSDHPLSVSKIAFLNPYLAANHLQTAEIESTARLITAAERLGIEVKVFSGCEEIAFFDPDFVVTISFQAPKLTGYPTYGLMDVPISLIKDVPRFVRNVLTYDGFMTIAPSVVNWLQNLCKQNQKKSHIAHAAFSVPRTIFKKANFEKACAMYIGTNWDGQRHNQLFNLLSSGEYLKCYGPKTKWQHYPETLYGGEIPFDGVSVLNTYHRSAAGLCIGHPVFDEEGIPSSRTFEIAAASALPICSDIAFNRNIYGDAALYINKDVSTEAVAEQIKEAVLWIRSHPEKAAEMAHAAHDIFSKQLSMEHYLTNLVAMHDKVMLANHFDNKQAAYELKSNARIGYVIVAKHVDYKILPLLTDLENQTYASSRIIILTEDSKAVVKKFLLTHQKNNLPCKIISYQESHTITNQLKEDAIDWVGFLTVNDRIFKNHLASLIETWQTHSSHNQEDVALLFSGYLEFTDSFHVPERMSDGHGVPNQNRIRVGSIDWHPASCAVALLLNNKLLNETVWQEINFNEMNVNAVTKIIETKGISLRTCQITCAFNLQESYIVQQQNEIASLRENLEKQKVNEYKQALDEIYNSRSWRYLQFLKAMINQLRKIKKLILKMRESYE